MTQARWVTSYAIVAVICALTNVAVLVAGDWIGLHVVVSATASFAVCVIVGFLLHSRFTYREPVRLYRLWRYVAAMFLNYPLSILAVWLFNGVLALPMIVAAPCATAALTAYNFLSSRWAIASRA